MWLLCSAYYCVAQFNCQNIGTTGHFAKIYDNIGLLSKKIEFTGFIGQVGWLNSENLNSCQRLGGRDASSCQISSKSVKQLQRYHDFSIFEMAAGGHFYFQILEILQPTSTGGRRCITVANFVKISRTVVEILQFFKMAAVHHLGFVFRFSGPTRKAEAYLVVFTVVQNLVAIYAVVLIIWEYEYFACLAWKCPFSCSHNYGFWGSWPNKWGGISTKPKRHILAWKDVIWRIDRQNRSIGATCARAHETKVKETLQWQTGYLSRPPTWSYRNTVWHGWWPSSSIVISFKFYQHRLSGYRAVRGRNLVDPELSVGPFHRPKPNPTQRGPTPIQR